MRSPGLRTAALIQQIRPLSIGLSIGSAAGSIGTLGCFARISTGEVALLSSASAIAPAHAEPGDYVHQPAPADQEWLSDDTRIARLHNFIVPSSVKPTMDAACAVLLDQREAPCANTIPADAEDAGRPLGAILPACELVAGDGVAKIGRSTGWTTGTITTPVMNSLSIQWRHATIVVSDLIEIVAEHQVDPFSAAGDSGALVWRRNDRRPVGIVLAAISSPPSRTYLLPIDAVCRALGVTLL